MRFREEEMLDLKIVGGTIVDGTGAPRYRGDIGVKDGVITALGVVDEPSRQTIDAKGKIVAPGFVDVHTHYDAQVFWDPALSPSCFHGVTTVFAGFCGFSIAPLSKESGAYLMPMLARVEGMPLESLAAGVPWNWTSFAEYLSRFEGTLAINAGFMAGHSAIRRYVMGPRAISDHATRAELDQMKELLRESIRGGAMGLSSTVSVTHNDADGTPVPSRHASREEIVELYGVLSEFEGTTAEFLPSPTFTDETYEILTQVSLAARRPVNWNAIAVTSMDPEEMRQNEIKIRASDYARERGAQVTALTLPQQPTIYINFISAFIIDSFPGWAPLFQLSIPARMEKLRNPEYRAMLKAGADSVTGIMKPIANYTDIKVVEVFSKENQRYLGRVIGAIAADEGRDPFEVYIAIALADELRTSFSPNYPKDTTELYRERARLWNDPRTVIGASDAGAHLDMINTAGIATSVLAQGVREHGVISLEQGVHLLTQKPAQLMGLKDRGVLKDGWHADIVVFDADKIHPGQEYTRDDLPAKGRRLYSDPKGVDHVIVNGREIVRDGRYLGTPAGIVLRPGKDTYTVSIPSTENQSA